MKKSGIVLHIEKETATLLLAGGEFYRTKAKPGWQKGQTVQIAKSAPAPAIVWRVAAVAACLLLLIGVFAVFRTQRTVSSVISMDINPSIELELNSGGRVISAQAYNDDGSILLANVAVEGKPYKEALLALLQSEPMQLYLRESSFLSFTVYSENAQPELLAFIDEIGTQLSANYTQLAVACAPVTETTLNTAHHSHMTSGRWLALQQLQEVDPSADIDTYQNANIEEIHGHIQQCQEGHQGQSDSRGGGSHGESPGHNASPGSSHGQSPSSSESAPPAPQSTPGGNGGNGTPGGNSGNGGNGGQGHGNHGNHEDEQPEEHEPDHG